MHFPQSRPISARILVILVSYVTASLLARAAESEPAPSLTVSALVDEALAKNPELKFYEAEITAAKAGRKTAGLLGNPQLSGDVGHNAQKFGGLSGEGVAWSVSVLQPFEWPGRIGLRKAIANHDIELAQFGYERFKIALASRVRALAYGLFAAHSRRCVKFWCNAIPQA
jgi:cobalt-zinc-cadmium efflux system outer membrane protein